MRNMFQLVFLNVTLFYFVSTVGEFIQNSPITYKDLNPIFFQRDDPDIEKQWAALIACTPPILCEGKFHFEYYKDIEPSNHERGNMDLNMGKPNCTGSFTVYTKSKLQGDSLRTEESLHQVMPGLQSTVIPNQCSETTSASQECKNL